MNRTHHFWVAMGCLEQGAAAQPDDADAGVDARGEPKLIQQGDHRAASSDRAARYRRDRDLSLAELGPLDQLATPDPACLNRVGARLGADPPDLRGQHTRQCGILPSLMV